MNNFYQNPNYGIYGGYPNGYPSPNLEVTTTNGSFSMPSDSSRISFGGYDPTSGIVNPPMVVNGFNPYSQYSQFMNQNSMNPQQGFNVYDPFRYQQPYNVYGMYSPYKNFYGQYNNNNMSDFLYDMSGGVVETSILENIVLSDAERKKISRPQQTIIGRDYYGRPIYSNGVTPYQASQVRRNMIDEYRKNYQAYYVSISKIAHGYSHEKIDEQKVADFFDPYPQQNQYNYYNYSNNNSNDYNSRMMLENIKQLQARIDNGQSNYMEQKKMELYKQIKESHDKILGFDGHQHYSLNQFLDNAHNITISILCDKSKSLLRNGTNKYSQKDFRSNLAMNTNRPVPLLSSTKDKDDEYISIEDRIKNTYNANKKRIQSTMYSPASGVTFRELPVSEYGSEYKAHQEFLKALQAKKDIDEVRRKVI